MSDTRTNDKADCVLCGKCLEVCPLLAATGREELSPRAKAHLVALLGNDPDLLREQDVAKLAQLCLGCGRCREVCSQGVNVPEAVSRLREKHPGWKAWLWKHWMARPETLWPLAGSIAAKLPNAGPQRFKAARNLGKGLARKPLEPFIDIEFPPAPHAEGLLFSGCAAGNGTAGAAPYWTTAAQALCSSLNISLIEAPFACCGSGLTGAGLRRERREAARRNVEIWRAGGRVRLITFCASCHAGLAAYAQDPDLFSDPEEAQAWTNALTPLSDLLKSARFVVSPQSPQVIAYHRPCHTHGADADEALVRTMLGGREVAVSKECCGFGGVLQLGAPELAGQVARRGWTKRPHAPGTLLLTGCTACVFQLAATAPQGVAVAHWLECLKTT